MAENPLAIRASEEVKALFNELAEQGEYDNKGEFLGRLLITHQAEVMKKEVSLIKPAIETVETLTSRLLEVLNGTAASIMTKEESQKQELEEQRKSFEETRSLLQQRITSLEHEASENEMSIQSLIADGQAASKRHDELQANLVSLKSTIIDKQALIDEYKSKNDTLILTINEYKLAAEENKVLQQEKISLSNKVEELESKIEILKDIEQQQVKRSTADMELQREAQNIKHEKDMLELKIKYQAQIHEVQNNYSLKISEYEKTVKELLFEKAKPKSSSITRATKKTSD